MGWEDGRGVVEKDIQERVAYLHQILSLPLQSPAYSSYGSPSRPGGACRVLFQTCLHINDTLVNSLLN